MELLHAFFQKIPMAALFLSVAIGYWVGKIQIGKFQLGGMAGTLLAAVVIGQVGVPVDAEVKSIMFALFIYATGYVSGPQFFASLNRKTISQLHLALISAITVFAFIFIVVKVMDLDKGTAAGLLAGATTESASIGTAGEALQRLGLAADKVKALAANIGVTYTITYLFGMLTVIFFASRVAPRLSRLMGNKLLYRKLLLDFGENYGGAADEIREALATKDFKQVHSLVHNLKGLSGNLEATDLQAAAVEMEKLVKGNQKETPSTNQLDQKLMELEKAIDKALQAVRSLGLPVEEKIIEPSNEWTAEVPLDRLNEVVDHIKAAAEMGDVMQIKSIAEELKSESDGVAPFCDELIRLAEDFDFDGLQKIVLELDS